MNMLPSEELLDLGSALYLIGLEIDATQENLLGLIAQGFTIKSPEVLTANKKFGHLCIQFSQLEERFLYLKKKLQSNSDMRRHWQDRVKSGPLLPL